LIEKLKIACGLLGLGAWFFFFLIWVTDEFDLLRPKRKKDKET